jgi:hypothetical protein
MDLTEVGWGQDCWTGSIWLSIEQVAGSCLCGNEPAGSKQCGELLDKLRIS